MMRVTIELDAPSSEYDVLTVTRWVSATLSERMSPSMVIRRIETEEDV